MAHTIQSLAKEWEASARSTERVELWANGKVTITAAAGGFVFQDDEKHNPGKSSALALGRERNLRVWDCASRSYL